MVVSSSAIEEVYLRGTVKGNKLKDLLVSGIRCLIVNAGVQMFVIVAVKIVDGVGLRVG